MVTFAWFFFSDAGGFRRQMGGRFIGGEFAFCALQQPQKGERNREREGAESRIMARAQVRNARKRREEGVGGGHGGGTRPSLMKHRGTGLRLFCWRPVQTKRWERERRKETCGLERREKNRENRTDEKKTEVGRGQLEGCSWTGSRRDGGEAGYILGVIIIDIFFFIGHAGSLLKQRTRGFPRGRRTTLPDQLLGGCKKDS